jgi:peptidoglycan/LPS O-acetylase OafA/YrhL
LAQAVAPTLDRTDGHGQALPPEHAARFYLPELDALRFFAFLAVFAFHASLLLGTSAGIQKLFDAGFFGVDLFFALSAYLITQLLLRERATNGAVDAKYFYVRRALRIWPLYFFFLFVAYLPSAWWTTFGIGKLYLISYCLFVGNLAGMFLGYPISLFAHLWSVSIEEQFYLLWPWVVRKASTKGLTWIAAGLFVVAALTRLVDLLLGATWNTIAFGTFSRLDPIAVGVVLGALPRSRLPKFSLTARVLVALAGMLSWLLVARCFPVMEAHPAVLPTIVGYPLAALGCAAFLVATLHAGEAGARFLSNSGLIYLGRISYGLYVYHWPVLLIVKLWYYFLVRAAWLPGPFSWSGQLAFLSISSLVTFLAASASYRWLESPFLRLKSRFTYVASRPV